jgi:hypothetical protein
VFAVGAERHPAISPTSSTGEDLERAAPRADPRRHDFLARRAVRLGEAGATRRAVEPYYPENTLSGEEASEQLRAVLGTFFDDALVWMKAKRHAEEMHRP